ncbi:MAG: glycoside hydrolase family 13 protein [Chloroflexota bacterium]
MSQKKWWQSAVFYQIYPRSFADSNGDGIGDFEGMIQKVDYLHWLGVDAVWLSPHFPSPQIDWGYDVSDYYGVAPEYGTMEQFIRFMDELHRRDMRLVLDLVLNHTSDQHPWFVESRSSRDNPKRDWYVWKPPRDGRPPNDWFSTFGGPAWTFDPQTGEYYYHFFFAQQPDLNWRNPEVKQAMFDVVRYWLNLGVDGFRLDAIGTIFEREDHPSHATGDHLDAIYRDSRLARTKAEQRKANRRWLRMFRHQVDMPEVHELMRELRQVVDEFPEKVLIGETEDVRFYGNGEDELHLNFNFPLMHTNRLTPRWVRKNQEERLSSLPAGAWPCNTLNNHDSGRMMSQFGDGKHDWQIARVNLALLLTLKGTPFLYNGEEIGMVNHLGLKVEDFRDPLSLHAYRLEIELLGSSPQEAELYAIQYGRDKCRTPLQWANQPNAGFCPAEVKPWLPVHPNFGEGVNVDEQYNRPDSMLAYYRRLLQLRQSLPALIHGDYQPLDRHNPHVFSFLRRTSDQTCLIALNMKAHRAKTHLSENIKNLRCVFSTHRSEGFVENGVLSLQPFEVWIGLAETL